MVSVPVCVGVLLVQWGVAEVEGEVLIWLFREEEVVGFHSDGDVESVLLCVLV